MPLLSRSVASPLMRLLAAAAVTAVAVAALMEVPEPMVAMLVAAEESP